MILPPRWLALALACLVSLPATPAFSQADDTAAILIHNVRIFDGLSARLSAPSAVLVKGNRIEQVGVALPAEAGRESLQVIDGGGRTLMPGLIDAHWHTMMASIPMPLLLTGDTGYLNFLAAQEARDTLMRGFTSVRDLSGPAFGLKKAVDEGLVMGPRIWPSGAMISQTGGHGDFRMPYEVPAARNAPLSRGEAMNGGVIADGVDEVRKRVREQLMLGATQIKLAAGGGISSHYDPIDVAQYSEAEFRAAVEAAENWGTYVTVHAYTPRAIQAAVRAGVKVIDHGQLMDEPTARLMARNGVWLSVQAFADHDFTTPRVGEARAKQLEVYAGTDQAFALARKYRLKTAWGSDILFQPQGTRHQGALLASMQRWFQPHEVLRMATSTNAELLALSGPRNPYPGALGVIRAGAYADLLLVNGDPIANLDLLADPAQNLALIMKDGRIYKNQLAPAR